MLNVKPLHLQSTLLYYIYQGGQTLDMQLAMHAKQNACALSPSRPSAGSKPHSRLSAVTTYKPHKFTRAGSGRDADCITDFMRGHSLYLHQPSNAVRNGSLLTSILMNAILLQTPNDCWLDIVLEYLSICAEGDIQKPPSVAVET